MQENTKQLVNSITTGEHSQEATDFVKQCVDHVEATRGPSKYTQAVRDALQRQADAITVQYKDKLESFFREHPSAEGCILNKDGTVMETGPFRPVGKFTEFFPISGKTST